MSFEQVLTIVDHAIQPSYLNKVQRIVLQQTWEGKTYSEIAAHYNYDNEYIRRVGYRLWQLLSSAFKAPITKSNFQQFMRRYKASLAPSNGSTAPASSNGKKGHNHGYADAHPVSQDWGAAPDVSTFQGREKELAKLKYWTGDESCRLILILGMVGTGKTSLAVRFAQQQQFDYIIWRSLRNAPPIEETLNSLLRFFSEREPAKLSNSLEDKILQLLSYLRQHRCLIILDDLQSVLNQGLAKGYRSDLKEYGQFLRLLVSTSHQSLSIVTSWEKPRGLIEFEGEKIHTLVLEGLPSSTLKKIFQDQIREAQSEQWQVLLDRYAHNPKFLKIAISAVQELFQGNIAQFLLQKPLIFDEIRILLDQQSSRLSRLEREICYWLAVSCSPTSLEQLCASIDGQGTQQQNLPEALISLQQQLLIKRQDNCYFLLPIIREYWLSTLIEKVKLFESREESFA